MQEIETIRIFKDNFGKYKVQMDVVGNNFEAPTEIEAYDELAKLLQRYVLRYEARSRNNPYW